MPDASIVVCTRDRAESLERCLHRLQASIQFYAGSAEIVVVDNGSTDDTPAVAERWEARRIWVEEPNKSGALNAAVADTDSEYILFLDDDVLVEEPWVARMVEPLEQGGHGVVGRIVVPPERRLPWMIEYHLALMAHTDHFAAGAGDLIGASMAVHRRVFGTIPGFDTEIGPGALGFGEDTLFSLQVKTARMRIAFAHQAVGVHWFPESRLARAGFLERAVAQGRSQAYLRYHWLHEDKSDEDCAETLADVEPAVENSRQMTLASPHNPAPISEIELHNLYGLCLQYPIESRRPRNYHKHGLQKLHP